MMQNQLTLTNMQNRKKRPGGLFEYRVPRKKRRWINCLGKSLFDCRMKGGFSNFVCEFCRTRKISLGRARLTKRCKCFIYEYGKKVSGVSVGFFEDVAQDSDGASYNLVVFPTSSEALLVSNLRRFREELSSCETISDRCGTDSCSRSTWQWADGIPLRTDKTNHKLLPLKLKMNSSDRSPTSPRNKSAQEDKNSHGEMGAKNSESQEVSFDQSENCLLTIIKNQKLKLDEQDQIIKKQKEKIDLLTQSPLRISVPVYSFLERNSQLGVSQLFSFPDLWI